jgi:hypothetical protein
MKFRKKPIVIEAFKWTGSPDQTEDPEWIIKEIKKGNVYFNKNTMMIKTLEGTMITNAGDWVIQGVKGEIYPCKPDIFEETYEAEKESKDV